MVARFSPIMYTMTKRDTVTNEILNSNTNNMLFEMATGSGKTKIALQVLDKRIKKGDKVLIVVPRLVLIEEWKKEISKWKYDRLLNQIEFVTYVSFPKKAGKWSVIIYDECHHLSERCREAYNSFESKINILLSATVGRNLKREILGLFPSIKIFQISTREAIEDNVLPDPKVILIPMKLDNINKVHTIVKNKGKGNPITIDYKDRFKYRRYKGEIQIRCTQREYYNDMSSLIEWYKNRIHVPVMKNMYLHKCGDRLKWLSKEKTECVQVILDVLREERVITFCSSIEQTMLLGKYCINSKNSESSLNLEKFNNKQIKHITCVNMLDEGCNLSYCKIGVYANLNSSERIIIQRLGRLLRHKSPVIIIPYYVFTRDEEIVKKMCENYNKELIKTLSDIQLLWQEL